ncbi:MAG: CaiB/BaiF CoA transferase family protein [Pseudorhodoplanes sp.]
MNQTQKKSDLATGGAFQPLGNLRVLDLTQFLAGPFGTQILGDLGADVIKLEGPQGDHSRVMPPNFVANDSVYYLSINRNKRAIALDLKSPKGRELAYKLALTCDVVIENFRPGILDRLGLSHAKLRAEKPSLIWCSISGFGQTGPYRDKPAYDMIVQALSGGMSMTGEVGRPAVRAGIPIGDLTAGLYAVIGVLAALNRRRETGQGDYIDVSMLDCQAALLCYQAAYYLNSGVVPGPQGRMHDSIATYRSFTAGDGIEVVVTANTERMWQGLCRALGVAHLIDDPRFNDIRLRHQNRLELWPLLEAAFKTKKADEWVPLLEAEEVPVGVVNTLDRVMVDPQIVARGMVASLAHDDGRKARVIGNPLFMESNRGVAPVYPPALGENSKAILSDVLGLEEKDMASLVDEGVVIVPR